MTVFSLNGKGLKLDTAKDIEPYLKELDESPEKYTEIDLVGNTIGVEASEALAKSLAKLENLEVANISDIYTGRLKNEIPQSLDAILTALLSCKKLHTVDLSDNAFGIATIDPLEAFLSKHTPLEHLILANNGLGPAAGARVADALTKLADAKKEAGTSAKLRTVICGRNRLEAGSMESWAKLLAAHKTVKEIRLFQNGIRLEGIAHLLLHGLAESPELEKLDLQDNTFSYVGAVAISKVVNKWPNIKEINISDCLLNAKGARLFASTLLQSDSFPHLETLKIQYNGLDHAGLENLKDAIKEKMPTLKLLELNGNCFPEDHEFIEEITQLFEERGFGELDELDDMEELSEDEDEDEDEEEEEEEEQVRSSLVKDDEEAEDENVAAEKSKDVDELANDLAKVL